MTESLTIDYIPDNRDVYHTLDGLALFGFRFEEDAAGWSIYADYLPGEVAATLPADNRHTVRVGLEKPASSLREAKAYAAQWAEQVWRERSASLAVNDAQSVLPLEETIR